jgi:cytoskeletal protein RodZ
LNGQTTEKNVGFLALAAAVPLYVGSLLFSSEYEPLLIVAMLILFGMGLFRSTRAAAEAPNWEDPFTVRLNREGKQGSPERKHWLHIQTQRGRCIRQVLLFVLITALALFVENHVTGSIFYSPSKEAAAQATEATPTPPEETALPAGPSSTETPTSPGESATPGESPEQISTPEETVTPEATSTPGETATPEQTTTPGASATPADSPVASPTPERSAPENERSVEEGPLTWVSHADRVDDGRPYAVRPGDNLARVARTKETVPSLLGAANPAAVLDADTPLKTSLNDQQVIQITIEEASQRLQLTPALFASRFATTPLAGNQTLKIPADRPYDPRQWIDWMLWTLIGMTAALLLEVARYLRTVPDGEGDFLAETSWYWAQLATGPLIAFVILLLFVHIDVDLLTGDEAALEVNLREYPSDLLLVPAFLLGFYSRVTREVLDQLMRRVFGAAWRAANGDFEIVMKGQDVADGEIPSSSPVNFETKPSMAGTLWNATDGTIDSMGVFKPPSVEKPTQVFVTAVAPGTNRSAVKSVTVVKHKFKIDATGNPDLVLQPGKDQPLTVQPAPPAADSVTWEIVPPVPGFSLTSTTGASNTLTVPATVTPNQTVNVKVTLAGLSRTISLRLV